MSLINRFMTTQKGAMIFTGNTLGLSRIRNDGRQLRSIEVFMTMNIGSQVPGYPRGTTLSWQNNGSQAILDIPEGAIILYAELQWGGTSIVSRVGDVSSFIDTPINFITPTRASRIFPDCETAVEVNVNTEKGMNQFYSRSQNVTDLIKGAGCGVYSVSEVPAIVGSKDSLISVAGWTLGVIYADSLQPVRRMILYAGLHNLMYRAEISIMKCLVGQEISAQASLFLTGILDHTGIQKEYVFLGERRKGIVKYLEADNLVQQFSLTSFYKPFVGFSLGWDICNIWTKSFVTVQSELVVQFDGTDRGYGIGLLGVVLDINNKIHMIDKTKDIIKKQNNNICEGNSVVNKARIEESCIANVYGDGKVDKRSAVLREKKYSRVKSNLTCDPVANARLQVEKEANKTDVGLNDTITYKITLINTGDIVLYNVVCKEEISAGGELIKSGIRVNGEGKRGIDLKEGIDVGSIGIGQRMEIGYQVSVEGVTTKGVFTTTTMVEYKYRSGEGKIECDQAEQSSVSIPVKNTNTKWISYNRTVEVDLARPAIDEVDDVSIDINIVDYYVLGRSKAMGIGRKLIVQGQIDVMVEYTGNEPNSQMYFVEWHLPMSELMLLPIDYEVGQYIQIQGGVQDIYWECINEREIIFSLEICIFMKFV